MYICIIKCRILKKLQLRNIIRESIKELITEQRQITGTKTDYSGKNRTGVTLIPPSEVNEQGNTPCPPNKASMTLEACPNSYHWTGVYIPGPWHCLCCTVDGTTPTQANIGTIIDHGPMNSSHGPNNFKVLSVGPGYSSNWQGSMHTTPYCCADPVQTGQGGCISSCGTCDPSTWGNHQNWINTWPNNNAFNSSNPLQPCTHICNKIQQWTNQCANAGPVQQNVLACKIAEGQNQSNIHGCNC